MDDLSEKPGSRAQSVEDVRRDLELQSQSWTVRSPSLRDGRYHTLSLDDARERAKEASKVGTSHSATVERSSDNRIADLYVNGQNRYRAPDGERGMRPHIEDQATRTRYAVPTMSRVEEVRGSLNSPERAPAAKTHER